jgi:hypothetical protein
MIVIDENDDKFKESTLTKWQLVCSDIKLEDAIYCEKTFISYVNGEITLEESQELINKHLILKGLLNNK